MPDANADDAIVGSRTGDGSSQYGPRQSTGLHVTGPHFIQKPTEGSAAEADDMAAFNRDPDTWPFRQYWQASDMRFIELTELLENVVAGKITIDNDAIEQRKEAVLPINQIAHVRSEPSKAVGQGNLLGAMNIAYTYDARAAAARSNLTIVLSWQPDTPLRAHP